MAIEPKLRKDIVNFLINFPFFQSENGRKSMLLGAGLDDILPTIDLSGSTAEFVSLLVEYLDQYGTLPDQQSALIRLLQGVATQVGQDRQETLQAFCERLISQAEQTKKIVETCPYRGLFAFREQDEPFFFGRETYTKKLVEAVRKQKLIAVIGASGSGKSSLVYAGLIPRLRRQSPLEEGRGVSIPSWEGQGVGKRDGNWLITSFRPGDNPFQAVAKSLIPFLYSDELECLSQTKKLAEQLLSSEISLSDVITRIIEKDGQVAKFLLFADQFEELYTPNQNDHDRRRFLDELFATSGVKTSVCKIILTLRADFLGKALAYRPFADALQETDIKLGPMNREELRETIERPAKALDVAIEDGLTDRILDAVGDEPGNLPLLEFALTELWKKQTDQKLTHDAYEEIGGVEKALASYAESVYNRLNPKEQQQARMIFTELVRPGEGTEDTRRVATSSEIGEDNWELVTRLANARLVVTGKKKNRGRGRVSA